MMLRLLIALSLLLALPVLGEERTANGNPYDSVYRIRATGDGHVADGSAVLVAPGRLLTSCHVIRHAKIIRAGREQLPWLAKVVMTDIAHDLCILSVPELSAAHFADIGPTEILQLNDPVIAVGYPRAGRLKVTRGEIKGLHPYDGGRVIQVSAPFDHGQSGGALFDASGRLIGIIGFKAIAGGDFHYALPLAWIDDAMLRQDKPSIPQAETAFWQRQLARKPLFLQAASLEASRDWQALRGVAQEWVGADQYNPAAWRCLGRMLTEFKREQAAAAAFARAESLLPLLSGTLQFPGTTATAPVKVAEMKRPSANPERQSR